MPSLIAKTNNEAHEERDLETKIAELARSTPNWG
jgi:hypothetical protein